MMNISLFHSLMGKKRAFLKAPLAKSKQRFSQLTVSLKEIFRTLPRIKRPIFVTGTARSNTTFLSECLSQHPQVHGIHNELVLDWERFAHAPMGCPFGEAEECPPIRIGRIPTEALEGIRQRLSFRNAIEGKGKKGRFLNHNPHLANKLPLVHQAFPQATLIFTSRDVRSTVASLKVFWEKIYREFDVLHYLPPNSENCWSCYRPFQTEGLEKRRLFPGGDVALLAEYWLRMYRLMEEDAPLFEDFIPVKHRVLLEDPRLFLETITRQLGLDPFEYDVSQVDARRNQRWERCLTPEDKRSLDEFIERNSEDIQGLRWADTDL